MERKKSDSFVLHAGDGYRGKDRSIVMVWKQRWSWWCGSYGEGGAVEKGGKSKKSK